MGASARRRRQERRAAKNDPEAKGGGGGGALRVPKTLVQMQVGHAMLHKSWRDMLWLLASTVAVYCIYRAVVHHATGMDKVLFFGFEFLGAGSFLAAGRFVKTCSPSAEESLFLNKHAHRGLALAACQFALWVWFLEHEQHGAAMKAKNWPLAAFYWAMAIFSYKFMESQSQRMNALQSAVAMAANAGETAKGK